ncbi:alpha/beta fold hydrolase [Actinomadura rugatobispora]|uniref:Alpha/beta fold hydrolase n=1 Tax=Actinomadura rugatobispora TaxID=1994 RepID=A0ABW1AC83_9ACTN|nr:hypothetical protein GCM10010200_000180 [Actinomadura rugatobispora]
MTENHTLAGPHGDGRIVVQEEGDPSAPVLVFLHSEFGAYDPLPLSEAVLASRRVLQVHLPGWGVSTCDRPFGSLAEMSLALWWALDALGVGRVSLFGHGIGGTVAAEMAAGQPQRVRAATLVAPFGMFDEENPGADVFGLLPRDLVPSVYADPRGEVHAAHFPPPADAHEVGLATIRRVQVLGEASNYLFPIPDTGIAARLYRLAGVPVQLLWGGLDGVVPPELEKLWVEHLPHAESTVLDGVSHMAPYETPEVSAAMLDFQARAGVE